MAIVDLTILKRPVKFSFWPTGRGTRRAFLQSRLFASNPWSIIRSEAENNASAQTKDLILALLRQGEDLFEAANNADVTASRPLLIYYSFMQLAKAFCLLRGTMQPNVKAKHGISESLTGPVEFSNSQVEWYTPITGGGEYNVFPSFMQGITGMAPVRSVATVRTIFEQILIGHRLLTQVLEVDERFVEIDNIKILHDELAKTIWPQLQVKRSELTRLGYAAKDMITVPQMAASWILRRAVNGAARYELRNPITYTGRPSDVLLNAANAVKPFVWSSVLAVPPFRKYYLYRATGVTPMLPQLASIYAGFYYLGSLTRYRPDKFQALLMSTYGATITEFIENQPMQFLYLMASEFAEQEVTRAAIV